MVTRKRSGAMTEEKILEAALKLFSEQGYAATATSQIAAVAEVSEGTVFKYFPKKMDLLRRVLYQFLDKYSAQIVVSPLEKIFEAHSGAEPKVMLRAVILDRVSLFERFGPFAKVLLTEMQYYPELKDIFVQRILVEMKSFGESVFIEFEKTGYFRQLPSSFVALRSFIGAVGMMILQRHIAPEVTEKGMSLEAEIDCVIDIFLNGVMKTGENHE